MTAPAMTLDEFLARLRETPRDWQAATFGIRCKRAGFWHCPITVTTARVTGLIYRTASWRDAATALRLNRSVAGKIVAAADGYGKDRRLRAELRRACGLAP